ncbi:MAG: hypothetical protein M3356_06040, partial [Actinomycetota bacterium]|nr:hypothetical protein [Actinomycetota bacterium]
MGLAAGGHPCPAAVQAMLGTPGALEHLQILAALGGGDVGADVRCWRWCQAASTSRRRPWPLPALVIEPRQRCSPEERSDGTSSDEAHQLLGRL